MKHLLYAAVASCALMSQSFCALVNLDGEEQSVKCSAATPSTALTDLPPEMVFKIMDSLSIKDLGALSQTSKFFNSMVQDHLSGVSGKKKLGALSVKDLIEVNKTLNSVVNTYLESAFGKKSTDILKKFLENSTSFLSDTAAVDDAAHVFRMLTAKDYTPLDRASPGELLGMLSAYQLVNINQSPFLEAWKGAALKKMHQLSGRQLIDLFYVGSGLEAGTFWSMKVGDSFLPSWQRLMLNQMDQFNKEDFLRIFCGIEDKSRDTLFKMLFYIPLKVSMGNPPSRFPLIVPLLRATQRQVDQFSADELKKMEAEVMKNREMAMVIGGYYVFSEYNAIHEGRSLFAQAAQEEIKRKTAPTQ